ncbi:MAG TPA: hypothetical protein VI540_03665 [Gaiellaceae bacterium]|nr:hypothetical protein [Gaiellaceae bacterium]
MPKATVLADRLGVIEGEGTVRYSKGDTVALSDEDFERHLASGSIEAPKKARKGKAGEAPAEESEPAAKDEASAEAAAQESEPAAEDESGE